MKCVFRKTSICKWNKNIEYKVAMCSNSKNSPRQEIYTWCTCSNINSSACLCSAISDIKVLRTQWLMSGNRVWPTNYSLQPQAALENKVLLEYGPKHVIHGCFHATVCRAESLWQRLYGPQKPKHLRFDSVQRKPVDPYLRIMGTNGLTNLCPA